MRPAQAARLAALEARHGIARRPYNVMAMEPGESLASARERAATMMPAAACVMVVPAPVDVATWEASILARRMAEALR